MVDEELAGCLWMVRKEEGGWRFSGYIALMLGERGVMYGGRNSLCDCV